MHAFNTNKNRLISKLKVLGKIGGLENGGVSRLALTDGDKKGRDLVIHWMEELGLSVQIDQIGNIIATQEGSQNIKPIMMGSHIDTVKNGGIYDGNLGVLAGLEVIHTLNDANIQTKRPIQVAVFTNEEGARFAPDMMGSQVFQGDLTLEDALNAKAIDGPRLEDELQRIGYQGDIKCPNPKLHPHAFIELHIEQGPLLEHKNIDIGVVTGVQGICWLELTLKGVANHAGTTPMNLRKDPMAAMAEIAHFVRQLTKQDGGNQVGTIGHCKITPNIINVIPSQVLFTIDIRNTNKNTLDKAEKEVIAFAQEVAKRENVQLEYKSLARFDPIYFDDEMIDKVEKHALKRGASTLRMPSGAGHDAGIIAKICPTAMIFVPSQAGVSHNPKEYTAPEAIHLGANILLDTVLELANTP